MVTLNKSKHAKVIAEAWKRSYAEELWIKIYNMGCCKKKANAKLNRFKYEGNLLKSKNQL